MRDGALPQNARANRRGGHRPRQVGNHLCQLRVAGLPRPLWQLANHRLIGRFDNLARLVAALRVHWCLDEVDRLLACNGQPRSSNNFTCLQGRQGGRLGCFDKLAYLGGHRPLGCLGKLARLPSGNGAPRRLREPDWLLSSVALRRLREPDWLLSGNGPLRCMRELDWLLSGNGPLRCMRELDWLVSGVAPRRMRELDWLLSGVALRCVCELDWFLGGVALRCVKANSLCS